MKILNDTDRNPGIVPPWLTRPAVAGDRNPGIVPPWLTEDPDTPRILPVNGGNATIETSFVREPATSSPTLTLIAALQPR
jgi:hypothetical protein